MATYSSLPITMRVGPGVSSSAARAARESGPSVDALTTPPIAKAMSAPVSALNCAARRSSSSVPMLKMPSTSGRSRPIVTGTLTTSSTPCGCSQNAGSDLAVQGEGDVHGAVRGRARHRFAGQRELLAAPSGDHQQIRAGLHAVVGGDRLQRSGYRRASSAALNFGRSAISRAVRATLSNCVCR